MSGHFLRSSTVTLHLPEPGGGMVCMQILWNTVEAVHNVLLSQEGVNNIDLFLDPFLFSECSRSLDWTSVDLPRTNQGNQHVIVFQDFLSKWPLVFPTPDQKAVNG